MRISIESCDACGGSDIEIVDTPVLHPSGVFSCTFTNVLCHACGRRWKSTKTTNNP